MADGRVDRVNYSGPTGGLVTEGEQACNRPEPGPLSPADLRVRYRKLESWPARE